jgi:cation diffusion facilitator CzcD-associated flavoprotein CzcO
MLDWPIGRTSSMTGLRVLVVGAGIAGLAVAHAARDRGIGVEVVERGRRARP